MSKTLSNREKFNIDQTLMEWWDAGNSHDKKHAELECYKEFKQAEFCDDFITYLRENDAFELADEMEHFMQVHSKVPHEHEKVTF